MLYRYSLQNLLHEYNKNRKIINKYNKNIEGYKGVGDDTLILGMSVGLFMFICTMVIAIYIWAVYALVVNWNFMPDWARAISVFGLITGFGGPVLALIFIYTTRTVKTPP